MMPSVTCVAVTGHYVIALHRSDDVDDPAVLDCRKGCEILLATTDVDYGTQ
jgi:hypothetical protein